MNYLNVSLPAATISPVAITAEDSLSKKTYCANRINQRVILYKKSANSEN
jgi:hypothetical protein